MTPARQRAVAHCTTTQLDFRPQQTTRQHRFNTTWTLNVHYALLQYFQYLSVIGFQCVLVGGGGVHDGLIGWDGWSDGVVNVVCT